MSATVSVQTMCQLLAKSKIMSADDARSTLQDWQRAANDPEDAERFRHHLINAGRCTPYQAALLAHGRTEGYLIDQFAILERIGHGRSAGVYRAKSLHGQIVALKVLSPSKAEESKLLTRFLREAELLVKLDHPNVVRCLGSGSWNSLHYIVLEFLEGETLATVLKRRHRLEVAEAVRVAVLTLMGLQHLHEHGMIHRDMKPANLMLVPATTDSTLASEVKILDVGLGRQLFDDKTNLTDQLTQLTGEGVLLGTPDYWAPEQAKDAHAVDIRADIYGLGCILYHCLTGQPPFPDHEVLTQIVRHATEAPRAMRDFNPAVPDGLQQVLNYMLAKDSAQRYPTPERAARALHLFLPKDLVPNEIVEDVMADKKPKPTLAGSDIPVGKLVTAKGGKTPRPKPVELAPAIPPPIAAPPPVPTPTAATEFDVELVAIPCPPQHLPRKPRDQRGLIDMDRRDFIMLGAGIGGSLVAMVSGLLVAKMLGRKPKEEKPGE